RPTMIHATIPVATADARYAPIGSSPGPALAKPTSAGHAMHSVDIQLAARHSRAFRPPRRGEAPDSSPASTNAGPPNAPSHSRNSAWGWIVCWASGSSASAVWVTHSHRRLAVQPRRPYARNADSSAVTASRAIATSRTPATRVQWGAWDHSTRKPADGSTTGI